MIYNNIQQALITFLESQEKNIQLDFFRENGEVILQLFKEYDVANWGLGVEFIDNGTIAQLVFNKNKSNNFENFNRFQDSDLFDLFIHVNFHGQNAFFSDIPPETDIRNIELFISKCFHSIYDINNENISFSLDAY